MDRLGQHREFPFRTFFLRRRCTKLQRPVRPGQQLVLLLRRDRHDFELGHGQRALPDRGADAVGAGVAAADDDDMLRAGEDRLVALHRLAADAAILLRQEFHREMDARKIAARHRQIARLLGAAGQNHRVVIVKKRLRLDVDADIDADMEFDAFGLHLIDAAVDQMLLHLEVGNAIAQQAAGLAVLLKDMHLVPDARELLRAGKAGGAGADDGDALAGLVGGQLGRQPAIGPGAIDDGAFDRLDRHRRVAEVERAGGFARRGADAAGEFGEIIGRMQIAGGFLPIGAIDEIVPVRDLIIDRAAGVAIGDAAIHAARGLILRRLLRQRDHEFLIVADSVGRGRIAPVAPVDLEETCHLAHANPSAAVRGPRRARLRRAIAPIRSALKANGSIAQINDRADQHAGSAPLSRRGARVFASPAPPPALARALDDDDFGLNQSKIMNVIDSNRLERDAGGKAGPLFLVPL